MSDDDSAPETAETADKFYRGTVERLQRGSQRGIIRSHSGREIPFVFMHVSMVGPHRRFDDLRPGLEVGYDVSWTSNGLRVSVIRIPD